ncbi:hypothetical protein B4114_2704 [Geobacillus stearothermophilus]|uniref:Uncharacterized protein n=1 Tax=Geobacillus stearothermophilus TaxID=1422 RepID=A0A150NE09_GEOSE|nr:hypothetical protein B4114_2704 [Geobacillus stearothermophilus]
MSIIFSTIRSNCFTSHCFALAICQPPTALPSGAHGRQQNLFEGKKLSIYNNKSMLYF